MKKYPWNNQIESDVNQANAARAARERPAAAPVDMGMDTIQPEDFEHEKLYTLDDLKRLAEIVHDRAQSLKYPPSLGLSVFLYEKESKFLRHVKYTDSLPRVPISVID